jgi:hypothetical protein
MDFVFMRDRIGQFSDSDAGEYKTVKFEIAANVRESHRDWCGSALSAKGA